MSAKAEYEDAAERVSALCAALRNIWDAHKDAFDDVDEFQPDFSDKFAFMIDDTLPDASRYFGEQAERCSGFDSDRAYDMQRADEADMRGAV